MGILVILPVVIGLLTMDGPAPSAKELADFSRLQSLVGQSVYVHDIDGQERLVRLLAATDQSLTYSVAARQVEMSRAAVLLVDRARDPSLDGAIKGTVFGLVLGVVASFVVGEFSPGHTARAMVAYGAMGFALDRGHTHRTPAYRAPTASVSLRF
jgi:hypothetical protein